MRTIKNSIKYCVRKLTHKGKRKQRIKMSFEEVNKKRIEMMQEMAHTWKCANTPGQYICPCGATGLWNRDLQKVEVEFPMPYETMRLRHRAHLKNNQNGVSIVVENM